MYGHTHEYPSSLHQPPLRMYVLEQLDWDQGYVHVKHSKDIKTQLGATELVHIASRPYSVRDPRQFRLFDNSEVYTAAVLPC